ncbi:MAG: hypothetical protein ACRCUY_02080 [Thermoguttaceae bacterium]
MEKIGGDSRGLAESNSYQSISVSQARQDCIHSTLLVKQGKGQLLKFCRFTSNTGRNFRENTTFFTD